MEQDSLPFQDQAGVMDIVVDGMWALLRKKGALQGHAQVVWLSTLHV
jgi:hypothetical protein